MAANAKDKISGSRNSRSSWNIKAVKKKRKPKATYDEMFAGLPVRQDNVNIGCTVENQNLADYRLPLFLSYPIKRRFIACAPLLEAIDISPYLHGVDHITVGGETSKEARECNYDWVLDIREQCIKAKVTFWFKNTSSLFKRDSMAEKVNPFKQTGMAKELGINILNGKGLF